MKYALVTGSTHGIGEEVAGKLLEQGYYVTLASRNPKLLKDTVSSFKTKYNTQNVQALQIDLCSLKSVKKCAEHYLSLNIPLHILVNNAGISHVMTQKEATVDGHEIHFGCNYLGHFLFTYLLTPLLLQNVPSIVVNVSSYTHLFCRNVYVENYTNILPLKPSLWEKLFYSSFLAYAHSKLCLLLLTLELNKRYSGMGLRSHSAHPGCANTNIYNDFDFLHRTGLIYITSPILSFLFLSTSYAARPVVQLCVDEKLWGIKKEREEKEDEEIETLENAVEKVTEKERDNSCFSSFSSSSGETVISKNKYAVETSYRYLGPYLSDAWRSKLATNSDQAALLWEKSATLCDLRKECE